MANAPLNSEARHEPRSSSLKNFPIILSLNDPNMVTLLILLGQEIVTRNSDWLKVDSFDLKIMTFSGRTFKGGKDWNFGLDETKFLWWLNNYHERNWVSS